MVVDGNGVPVWYVRGDPHSGVGDIDSVVSGAISFFSGSRQTLAGPLPQPLEHDLPGAFRHGARPARAAGPVRRQLPRHLQSRRHGGRPHRARAPAARRRRPRSWPGLGHRPVQPGEIRSLDGRRGVDVVSATITSTRSRTTPIVEIVDYLPDGGPVIDPFHCNSIDIEPDERQPPGLGA